MARVPEEKKDRIRTAYEAIQQLENSVNPVKKVLLVITGHESEVHMDEVLFDEDGAGAPGGGVGVGNLGMLRLIGGHCVHKLLHCTVNYSSANKGRTWCTNDFAL
mmetsp:Transcript_19788/g.28005  ORF Transcript_19788/g.28005 Transcript_19788/m.28005 type:complete len:105 (-) Transcript_19788:235-549(-)